MENPRVAYGKVCDFLGVADESPAIAMRRMNPFGYEDVVMKFEEVKAALMDTQYSWMLNK